LKTTDISSTLCGIVLSLASAVSHAVVVPLESRLGGQAFYDPNLDITWLADANAGAGSAFDDVATGSTTGTTTDGKMTWQSAMDWAASLTVGGVIAGTWRLASMDKDGAGVSVIDVPFVAPPMSPTSVNIDLLSGRYYFRVVAYSALNAPGGSGGSTSAPSAQISVLVP